MILSVNNYDPEEDEERRKSALVSAKEWRVLGVVVVVVIILLIPVYRHLMDLRNGHICQQNLLEISNAIESYCEDNNDRFPPVYATAEEGYEPAVYNSNQVFTWVSLLSEYTKKPEVFSCPAAENEEGVTNIPLPPNKDPIVSDYGMYGALSTLPRGSLATPQSQALICDSSTNGANGTTDPLPFKSPKGGVIPDGFLVGLNTSNFTPTDSNFQRYAAAKFATRVAAPNSAKSGFDKNTETRHWDGINVLMADLHLSHLNGQTIAVQHQGNKGGIISFWATP